ncbi:MAG: magnesium transporter [Gammaproteobacteria bacterium]|nr:magnesium transporter [Gammaproteobacteria bacterium]
MTTQVAAAAASLGEIFLDLYPGQASEVLESAPLEDVVAFLESQEALRAGTVLARMSPHAAARCVLGLSDEATRRVLGVIDPSHLATILSGLDETGREERLRLLGPALAKEIRELLSYPVDSAGQMMETRVISFRPNTTVKEVLARLRITGRPPPQDLVVVDDVNQLVGTVALSDIAIADPKQRLDKLIKRAPISVNGMAPRNEIVDLLSRRNITTLPVVDVHGRLLGVIRHDAFLVHAVQEEATADLQTMVGVSKEERALSTPLFAVRKRLPWLNINLLTAFLAAAVVGLFESTIAKFTALAVLLPVVAGQSGNTGAQALAVIMRGLALREIRARHWRQVLVKEFTAGTINGVAIAIVTGIGVFIWSQSLGLSLVIVLAMVISMAIAALSGAAIPVILTAIGQDPAQSSSIILTTVTDVVGFFSFLGLATVFANML